MEDYLRRAAIWPGAPVIDDPEGLLGEKVNRLYMFSHEPTIRYCKRGDFFQEGKWKNGKESMPQLFISVVQ